MFTPATLVIFVVWILICIALPVLTIVGMDSTLVAYYSNGIQIFSSLIASALCLYTMLVFKKGDPMRKIWGFLSLGLLSWGIGAIIYAAYPFFHGGRATPYPWYCDFGYLGMVPMIVTALIIFKSTVKVPVPLWGIFTATAVFLASLALSIWSSLGALEEANLLIEMAIEVAYIIFDPVLLATTVLCASLLAGGQVAKPWWYGFSGLLLYYLGNVAYDLLESEEAYFTGHWIDVSWPIAFGLVALAGLLTRNMFKLLDEE
jgi:hypothetical protein